MQILETALYVEDLDAAERFYGDLLGLERITRGGTRHVFYRCGSSVLLIFNPVETRIPLGDDHPNLVHGATGAQHVCFAATATELDRWRRRFEAAGVAIEADFRWFNGARSVYVRDPAGNSVEFAEPALWAARD